MHRSRQLWLFLVFLFALFVASCAYQPAPGSHQAPGFLIALVHGAIAPIALIVGFFSDVRVYAFPNSGWFYDLGFMLGLGAVWGGGSHVARR